MISFRELREQMSDEMIKSVLAQFNVEPVEETDNEIIFPTCCHNLEGGSAKLWYYKNSKLFHCFTECNSTFDIFTLLQKMMKLRGQDITPLQAATELCELNISFDSSRYKMDQSTLSSIRYMQELNDTYIPNIESNNFEKYDKAILRKYSFDYMGLIPWMNEGISIDALQRFNIKYDSNRQAIIIPNFDYDGNLIGVRARYLKPEDIQKGKYRPIYDNGVLYNHPTGRTFYGIYENHSNITRKGIAVIFESEKSVLLYNTIYGNDNGIALATLGQNITKDHIQYLLKMGVRHVILAYDSDYEDYDQLKEVKEKYIKKGKILNQFFNVSILIDFDFDLPYKSSPIDGGKEIFEKILKNRVII